MEGIEQISFQIISYAGSAKSLYHEALNYIKENDIEKANELMSQADQYFIEAHKVHAQLIQQEANEQPVTLSLLLVHAEDQLMNAEVSKDYIKQIIDLQNQINDLKQKG